MDERQTLFSAGIGDHNSLSFSNRWRAPHASSRFPPQNSAGPTDFNGAKNDLMTTNPDD
jgi:hypothetical protein